MVDAAVIMPRWIGDFILALYAVNQKARVEGNDMCLVVPDYLMPLARVLGVSDAIAYDRRNIRQYVRAAGGIRRRKLRRIYVLPHSFSTALLGFLAGVRSRRGVNREGRRFLLTDVLPGSLCTNRRHLVHEYAAVLETDAHGFDSWKGVETRSDEQYRDAIVFCPGAGFGPAKQWPGFDRLASMMPASRIVLLGSAADSRAAARVARSAGNVIDLSGRTSLAQACAIIAAARCVVSNDSGLMHVAGYVGTPVVGIFGSTQPSWTRPPGCKVRIVCTREPCSPCFKRVCVHGHYNCLQRVEPAQVFEAVRSLVHAA